MGSEMCIRDSSLVEFNPMKCGFCKFTVPDDALVCGHCGADYVRYFSFSKLIDKIYIPFIAFLIGAWAVSLLSFPHWLQMTILIAFVIFAGRVAGTEVTAYREGRAAICDD